MNSWQEEKLLMKIYEGSVIVLLIILTMCVVGGAISGYLWYQDNPIEEAAEQIIENKTGIDIDLTPSSPEFYEIA